MPEKVAAACLEFILGPLPENPHRLGNALRAQLAGLRSARRGSYRVIYFVDDTALRVDDPAEALTYQTGGGVGCASVPMPLARSWMTGRYSA